MSTDVYFEIVQRAPAQPFDSGQVEIEYIAEDEQRCGSGRVFASASELGGEIEFDDPFRPGEVSRTFGGGGSPGQLLSPNRFAIVKPMCSVSPPWIASRAYIENRSLDNPLRPHCRFMIDSIVIGNRGDTKIAFTREVYAGARIESMNAYTPTNGGGARLDRIEFVAMQRRTTILDLWTSKKEVSENQIAVIYEDDRHDGNAAQALWLTASLLAGTNLQPLYSESYDSQGNLCEIKYRLGVSATEPGMPPFHTYYAQLKSEWVGEIADGIKARLDDSFPIDVVIGHLHDSTNGSIERRMQSILFSIHAASEAWNLKYEKNTIIEKAIWKSQVDAIIAPAFDLANKLDSKIADAVKMAIKKVNYTGTGLRQRMFFERIGIVPSANEKKALNLRDTLFHNGYLTRRLSTSSQEENQVYYDQFRYLRDIAYRIVFGLVAPGVLFHSMFDMYKAIPVKNPRNH
jgi:hypothetical protein